MKKNMIIMLLLLMTLAYGLPFTAQAGDTYDGWMQGYNCVSHGHKCPVDRLDPHLTLEPDFVLLLDDGDYFLLPNLARDVKARYIQKSIRVVGDVNPKHKSIDVNKLQVKVGDSYKTVWSKKMMMEEWKMRQEEFYGAGGGA